MGNYLQKGTSSDSENESNSNVKQLKRKWSEYSSPSSSNLSATNSSDVTLPSSSSRSIQMRSPRKKISIIKKIYSASSSANENSSFFDQDDDDDTNEDDDGDGVENRSYSKKCPFNNSLVVASKKKMKSTSDYIFKTLFINGENSDVVVKALDKEWHLHKIYLCQSPYFDSMFKGCKWKESSQSYIEMAIPDQNITESALRVAFGSFYKEDIELIPLEVVNILACASLFSLDGLINQCSLVMQENLSHHTLVPYYDASILYGVKSVTDSALKWLCNNLMLNDQIRLNEISLSLFETVLSFNDLLIIQVETDLYSIAKKWLFYQLVDKQILLDEDFKFTQKKCNEYLRSLSTDKEKCLLEMGEYSKYSSIFRNIRLQHILSDLQSLKLLYDDRIIPRSWIEPFYYKNWLNLLFIDQSRLANEEFQMNEAEFENKCLRFGRSLADLNPTTWRWVYFYLNRF
jgi:BTB/POZ domain-containing protein 13